LVRGDRFLLDGRALVFHSREAGLVHARRAGGDGQLPRWQSDRQSLSAQLAGILAEFREEAAQVALEDGPAALRDWLIDVHDLGDREAAALELLFHAQATLSEIPPARGILIEESPDPRGLAYAFHLPLSRSACEAAARAVAARLGRRATRNLTLSVADLGWSMVVPEESRFGPSDFHDLFHCEDFQRDVLEGLDRGELLGRRFQYVAATALMVLKNSEGGRRRVGGMDWVSQRLYPLVRAACPDHPLLRETRREVLDDVLDCASAYRFFKSRPTVRFRRLDGVSPFAAAWLGAPPGEALLFEPPIEALRRLHARLNPIAAATRSQAGVIGQ
jgi:ATP-dependent Lhr-like helicase